jgi:hypothetical protein
MSRLPLFCALIVIVSCADKDPFSKLHGFWVSNDYRNGKPFQTLTITLADTTTLYGEWPLYWIQTNQYGAYPETSPMDTFDGHITVFAPHGEVYFTLNLERDTLEQVFSSRVTDKTKMKYIRMDSLKIWREAIFSDLQLQVDLPHANDSDNLMPTSKSLIVDLFLGPLKKSLRKEHPAIAQDSILLQHYDVLISSDEIERLLRNEQSKLFEEERDSILVVLNADREIPEEQIREWVKRVKSFNINFKVWRRYIDLDRRQLVYRDIER